MFLASFILGFLLIGTGDARSLTESLAEKNLQLVLNGDQLEVRKTLPQGQEPEERVGGLVTSIALSLILGLIRDMIRDTVFDILGISTTPPPGLVEALLGLVFPAPSTTTTTTEPTTTTTTTTAAPCGGVLGLGLLAEPCTTTTAESTTTTEETTTTTEETTTTTEDSTTTTATTEASTTATTGAETTTESTTRCGGLLGGG